MARLIQAYSEQLILWSAVLVVLTVVGVYLAGRLRAKPVQRELPASELLTKFRELHRRGVLSDAEFRTIKTTLTAQLQEELRNKADRDCTADGQK
jgi:uncharacterized membrane protein